MVTIKFSKKDNEISMTRMPVEDDLIERNARNRFWSSSKRKLNGIISVTIVVIIVVSVIKHKRSISLQYDNERYQYFFLNTENILFFTIAIILSL